MTCAAVTSQFKGKKAPADDEAYLVALIQCEDFSHVTERIVADRLAFYVYRQCLKSPTGVAFEAGFLASLTNRAILTKRGVVPREPGQFKAQRVTLHK